jgi:hypothetical protein
VTVPGCHLVGTAHERAQATDLLERLAAELGQRGCTSDLRLPSDRWPSLDVRAPGDATITERIVAHPGGLLFPWAARHLLARSSVRAAADRIMWVLRARARFDPFTTLRPAVDDLAELQQELAACGQPSDLVTPTPCLLLRTHTPQPIRIYPSGPCFYWSPGLAIGDRDEIPTAALNLIWALHTSP